METNDRFRRFGCQRDQIRCRNPEGSIFIQMSHGKCDDKCVFLYVYLQIDVSGAR